MSKNRIQKFIKLKNCKSATSLWVVGGRVGWWGGDVTGGCGGGGGNGGGGGVGTYS